MPRRELNFEHSTFWKRPTRDAELWRPNDFVTPDDDLTGHYGDIEHDRYDEESRP